MDSVTKQISEMDHKHALERQRLVETDTKDLKAMLPQLLIFHEDLKETSSNPNNDDKPASRDLKGIKYYDGAFESDDDTVDMPMDAKIS